jgi:hypothetical protein
MNVACAPALLEPMMADYLTRPPSVSRPIRRQFITNASQDRAA